MAKPTFSLTTAGRLWTIAALASASAGVALLAHRLPGSAMWDGFQLYLGARAILRGEDPYVAVAAAHLPFPVFYPLPAVLLFLPLAWLPIIAARMFWAAFNGAALAWAATKHGPPLLIAFLSASYLDATILGQMSPALVAATVLPGLGFVWAAKPTIGLALFAGWPSRRAALGVLGIVALSTVLVPSWPLEWLGAVRSQIHIAPVLMPGGFLLLLALLQWRRPEARMLAVLACVPHSIGLYDALPLFLIPRRKAEAYGLAIATMALAFISARYFPWHQEAGEPLASYIRRQWPPAFALVYLPALFLLLRRPLEARETRPLPPALPS